METKDETKTVAEEQLKLMYKRMVKAEKTGARVELITRVMSVIRDNLAIVSKGNFKVLVVGAGGSYPAAEYLKLIISEYQMGICDAATPQTALGLIEKVHYDLVVGITYSGRTPDIIAVYKAMRFVDFYSKFVIITGDSEKNVKPYYSENDVNLSIISYFSEEDESGKEKGMISMFSTLEPCFLAYNGAYEDHVEEIYRLSTKASEFCNKTMDSIYKTKASPFDITRPYIIHIIYDWKTYPAALDLESKITESGIGFAMIHESKNFSHGRYTILYKQDFDLIFHLYSTKEDSKDSPYEKELGVMLSKIVKEKDKALITMHSDEDFWYGTLEMLFKIPYLVVSLGRCKDTDIAKPFKDYPNGFPVEAKDLYNYNGIF